MAQPQDIMKAYRKAKKEIDDPNRMPDRFGDDVDQRQFWINMSGILYRELRKAVRKK